MDEQGFLKYVSVDAGLIGGSIDYYTGVVFKGFTYEVGFPIVSGGRYDNTVAVFGRQMECVGFSLSLTLTLTALLRQGVSMEDKSPDVIVGYAPGFRSQAFALVESLREEGLAAILDTTGMDSAALDEYSSKSGIDKCVYVEEES